MVLHKDVYIFWPSTKINSHLSVLGIFFPMHFYWYRTTTVRVQTWEICQVHSSECRRLQRDQQSVKFHTHIVHLWGPACVITVYLYSLDITYAKNDKTTDITFKLDSDFWRISVFQVEGYFEYSWEMQHAFQESLRMTLRVVHNSLRT